MKDLLLEDWELIEMTSNGVGAMRADHHGRTYIADGVYSQDGVLLRVLDILEVPGEWELRHAEDGLEGIQ